MSRWTEFDERWEYLTQFEEWKEPYIEAKAAYDSLNSDVIEWWETGKYGSPFFMTAREARALSTAYYGVGFPLIDGEIADGNLVCVWNHKMCEPIKQMTPCGDGVFDFSFKFRDNDRAVKFAYDVLCSENGNFRRIQTDVVGSMAHVIFESK